MDKSAQGVGLTDKQIMEIYTDLGAKAWDQGFDNSDPLEFARAILARQTAPTDYSADQALRQLAHMLNVDPDKRATDAMTRAVRNLQVRVRDAAPQEQPVSRECGQCDGTGRFNSDLDDANQEDDWPLCAGTGRATSRAAVPKGRDTIERAAWILESYHEYLQRLSPINFDEHPYLPEIEGTAKDLRAMLAAAPSPAPVAQEGEQMGSSDEIVGHKTFATEGGGFRHEPLTRGEADAIMAQVEASERRRAEMMPNESAARHMFFDAWLRLKEFGWREAVYCPKDGREFEVIEAGSTGIHPCVYQGEWPNGHWWITADGDMCPSRPVLFRAKNAQQTSAQEDAEGGGK